MNIKKLLKKFLQYTLLEPLDLLLILFFTLAIAKIISLNFSINSDDSNWEEFKAENHCQLNITEDGTESSTWLCDDGEVYYRWRQQR